MKTKAYFLDENGRLRFATPTTPPEQIIYLAQSSGVRDAAAANLLGIELENLEVVTTFKGREVITPIAGIRGESREALRPTKVKINKKAYQAVVAQGGGGKRRGSQGSFFETRDHYLA